MMPQFQAATARPNGSDFAVGLTLFVLGLFKKVVLADGIAQYVSPVYDAAAAGQTISLIPAWVAAIGFTLQIYFDFSGYSDMALGLGRLFGVKLPANFDSPLKARSIIEFWARWHITLARFLTAYVYNPLVMRATRQRLAKRLPIQVGPGASPSAFVQMLAVPTILTMLLSGLWHGAGYLFLLWGLMHGIYLVVNHAWRFCGPRLFKSRGAYERVMIPAGFLLTFVAVVAAMVVFRAPTLGAASEVFAGAFGRNAIGLPPHLAERAGALIAALPSVFVVSSGELERAVVPACAWIVALLVIALAVPNSLELTARFEPALTYKLQPAASAPVLRAARWQPTVAWALGLASLAVAATLRLGGKSEFLYWQF
jgi:D-alanyl-lipoteichoic acid acyltransferase DltB (MBOAT superfamily)